MLNKVIIIGHLKSMKLESGFARMIVDATPPLPLSMKDQDKPIAPKLLFTVIVSSTYMVKRLKDYPDTYKPNTSILIEGELAISKNTGNTFILVSRNGMFKKWYHPNPNQVQRIDNTF